MEERYLGPLGNILTLVSIDNSLREGKRLEAARTASFLTADTVICAGTTLPAACLGWQIGRSVGELINAGPVLAGVSDKTVNDWWSDKLADIYYAPNEEKIRRKIQEARQRAREAQRAAERAEAEARNRSCQADEKPTVRYAPRTSQQPPPEEPPPSRPRTPRIEDKGYTAPLQTGCRLAGTC
ncbi:hypothetical protein [Paracraurococcus ruber]|uniref:hypothetical protein n=1 Tax=Paracraurococcus ruber TaxID=77675 RepID=UPI001057F9E5|nr:hypothetical protein [Paracraurococcus ruber]TDG29375.1 hypothetical protein E2C05_17970 [Paracraurococcus ruber]